MLLISLRDGVSPPIKRTDLMSDLLMWGMYMMNNCEFPGGVLNHQLSELVMLRVVVTGQEYVCSQKKQRKLKSSPYSAPNTDLALMACSLLILRAEVQCGRPRNQPWSHMRIFNVPQ
ncbi:hypothetical protein DY000_02030553 [Brassica cretica]|nr:hypothetical protein DY000_02030553 [Brassica cretica]